MMEGILDKPFRTAYEQIAILESRGLLVPDRDDAARTLLSCNYYTLVNGYKDMLLDPEASGSAHEDRYAEGSSFDQLKLIYALDRGFRSATMDALMRAEGVMKTSLIHAFCERFGGGDSYLSDGWECGIEFYRGPKEHYGDNLSRLRTTLRRLRGNSRHKEYIAHYIERYGCVPLWVLAPCLTFGDSAMFFDFQGDAVQNLGRACRDGDGLRDDRQARQLAGKAAVIGEVACYVLPYDWGL